MLLMMKSSPCARLRSCELSRSTANCVRKPSLSLTKAWAGEDQLQIRRRGSCEACAIAGQSGPESDARIIVRKGASTCNGTEELDPEWSEGRSTELNRQGKAALRERRATIRVVGAHVLERRGQARSGAIAANWRKGRLSRRIRCFHSNRGDYAAYAEIRHGLRASFSIGTGVLIIDDGGTELSAPMGAITGVEQLELIKPRRSRKA